MKRLPHSHENYEYQDEKEWMSYKKMFVHSSLSLAVTVRTVCWMSSFSSTSASYKPLSKYGGLSFLSAMAIRMNLVTEFGWPPEFGRADGAPSRASISKA